MKLLKSAGGAIQALTTVSDTVADPPTLEPSTESQKEAFASATTQYFTLLSSIDVHLRRSIYALEEANILPAEGSSKENQTPMPAVPASTGSSLVPSAQHPKQIGNSKVAITGGGLGSLEVGWLNSRNDKAGREIEKDTWQEVERFLGQDRTGESEVEILR